MDGDMDVEYEKCALGATPGLVWWPGGQPYPEL